MTRRLALAAAGCAALSGLSAWAGWWKFAALTLLIGVLCSAIVWMIVGRPQSPPSISNELAAVRSGEVAPADRPQDPTDPTAPKWRGPATSSGIPPAPDAFTAWLQYQLVLRGGICGDPQGWLASALLDIARTEDLPRVIATIGAPSPARAITGGPS